jgi:hypothetical protein
MKGRAAIWVALGACGGSAPAEPTWVADVEPILSANCVRCHYRDSAAPSGFRLDVYDDVVVDGRTFRGARSMAEFSAAKVDPGGHPPVGPSLDGRQKDILRNWAKDPALGAHPANHAPTATLVGTIAATGLSFRVIDEDDDPVTGELRFGPGVNDLIPGEIHEGVNGFPWASATVAPGTYTISAVLRDGLGETTRTLGSVTVAHGDGTRPSLTADPCDQPPGDDLLLADRDSPCRTTVRVSDPDGGMLHLVVTATTDGDSLPVAERDIALTAGAGMATIAWDTTAVPAGAGWNLHFELTDSPAATPTVVDKGPIIVSHTTTTETFASVQPILRDVCGQCHNGTADSKVANTDFTTEVGIRALRGRAWRQVAQQRDMPPPTLTQVIANPIPLTEAQRAQLGEWLLAGAP